MRLQRINFFAAAITINCLVTSLAAQAVELCARRIPNIQAAPGSPPTPVDIREARRLDGSNWPLLYAGGRGTAWLLDKSGQLVSPNGFPTFDLWDQFTVERSGRVIGITPFGAQVYIQDPATGQFSAMAGADEPTIGEVRAVATMPGRNETLIATTKGLFVLAENASGLVALLGQIGGSSVTRIFNLPERSVAAIGMTDGRILLLNSRNQLTEVPDIRVEEGNWLVSISNISEHGGLLVQAQRNRGQSNSMMRVTA